MAPGGGQDQWLSDGWKSGADAGFGVYAVIHRAWNLYGEEDVNSASFIIEARKPHVYRLAVLRRF